MSADRAEWTGIGAALLFHVALIAALSTSLASIKDVAEPPSMEVELVDEIGLQTAAPTPIAQPTTAEPPVTAEPARHLLWRYHHPKEISHARHCLVTRRPAHRCACTDVLRRLLIHLRSSGRVLASSSCS